MSFQVKYIYDLVDKMSPHLEKIKANTSALGAKISVVAASSSASFSSFGSSVQLASVKVGASIRNMAAQVGTLGVKAKTLGKDLFLKTTLPLGLLGMKFIKSASDYQESLNKVDVAFGSAAVSVRGFANSAGKNFGIDRGTALDMAAMFGDMSTSMGLSQEKAGVLSTSLVGLAGDLASFKNIGVDQAQTALAGIFTGETESLKRLGIVMTETNVQQYALTLGIRKKMSEMKQDEKVMLRYNYIMAMSKNSQGDFLRTQEGFANQMRILSSRFKDLSITLGTILLPYATKLVNVAISLLEKFTALSAGTQKWILIISGIVAVAAPVLIILGAMAGGIAVLAKGIALLSVGIAFLWKVMRANPLMTLVTVGFLIYENWQKIVGLITKAVDLIAGTKFGEMLGIEKTISAKIEAAPPLPQTPIPQSTINQKSSVEVGGKFLLEMAKSVPSGTRMTYIPSPGTSYDTGTMGALRS